MLPCRWPLRIIDHDAAYRLRIDRTAKAAQIPGIAVAGTHQHVATDRIAVAMRLDRLDLPHLRQGRNPPRFAFHRTGTGLHRGVGIRPAAIDQFGVLLSGGVRLTLVLLALAGYIARRKAERGKLHGSTSERRPSEAAAG